MDMMYIEERLRYVIASLDDPTKYVKVLGGKKYTLMESLVAATKYDNRKLANYMIQCYRESTGDLRDLVVLPVMITYDLIDETEYTVDGDYV